MENQIQPPKVEQVTPDIDTTQHPENIKRPEKKPEDKEGIEQDGSIKNTK